jgi:hypothetical protein
MKNIEIKMDGNKAIITVDMEKSFGVSKSGKSTIIASTEGNKQIKEGVFMGLNIYKK